MAELKPESLNLKKTKKNKKKLCVCQLRILHD